MIPAKLKLTLHARDRLLERKGDKYKYNTKNIMRSDCKWFASEDLIPQSPYYIHSKYVCRKAKNKMRWLTNGDIEVLYDKNANVAITILEVPDKFKPITQYLVPQMKGE